jgi:hypothetical protein
MEPDGDVSWRDYVDLRFDEIDEAIECAMDTVQLHIDHRFDALAEKVAGMEGRSIGVSATWNFLLAFGGLITGAVAAYFAIKG